MALRVTLYRPHYDPVTLDMVFATIKDAQEFLTRCNGHWVPGNSEKEDPLGGYQCDMVQISGDWVANIWQEREVREDDL